MRILTSTFLALLLLLLSSCSEDPTDPEDKGEKYYDLLYSYIRHNSESDTSYILKYDAETGARHDSIATTNQPVYDLVFSSDGQFGYFTGTGGTVAINAATWDTVGIDGEHGGSILSLSNDNRHLAVSNASRINIYQTPLLQLVASTPGVTMALHPSEAILYSSRSDPAEDTLSVLVFSEPDSSPVSVAITDLEGRPIIPTALAVDPSGDQLYVGSGSLLLVVDAQTFETKRTFGDYFGSERYTGTWMHPEGNLLLFAYSGGTLSSDAGIDVYDITLDTLRSLATASSIELPSTAFNPIDIAFSPDGSRLFVLSNAWWTGPIVELDAETGELVRVLETGHGHSVAIGVNPSPRGDD
jgi:DNA-binding beta-propeller fold protein YncE